MSTPILICDDSSFARKQMARTLPPDWDVTISYAENGLEALDAVRAGKGNIMFLDLTMPIMDGYQVLEVIKKEDLPCMVIVVSGDVQPEAVARVKQLGALDFIEKPIDPDKTRQVLSEFGIL
ncbi:response regulator [Salinispirillum sp. LH 10-3-1]|uniref:Response regulator n=1 Tax=Salinispirillum sp. LH 10-3-1 TaxID=2952525 RepID=A0AB38YJ86_9GAMM